MTRLIVAAMAMISFVSTTAHSWECKQLEAQFFGKITEARTDRIDQGVFDCYLRIEFTDLKPSILCPLDVGPASSGDIYAMGDMCEGNYEAGDEISGYLVQTPDGRLFLDP